MNPATAGRPRSSPAPYTVIIYRVSTNWGTPPNAASTKGKFQRSPERGATATCGTVATVARPNWKRRANIHGCRDCAPKQKPGQSPSLQPQHAFG
ncbi:hypothetical protein VTK26DRAFT_7981 [Humicola hyalothermophila]